MPKTESPTSISPVMHARSGAIDWLRFIALIEIAGFHSKMGRIPLLDGLGLPLLLVITNLYNCTITERRGILAFIHAKLQRLLVPWVFWCIIFGAIIAAGAIRAGNLPTSAFSLRTLVAGTYPHLWFVPFALFGSVIVAALQKTTRTWSAVPVITAAFLIGLTLVIVAERFDYLRSWGEPGPQWALSFPSIFFGFAIGRALLLRDGQKRRILLVMLMLAGGLMWGFGLSFDGSRIYERYGAAVFLSAAALQMRYGPDTVIAFLAPLTLGIYLAHPLVMRFLIAAGVTWQSILAWASVDIVLTVFLVWGMRRTPLRRFV